MALRNTPKGDTIPQSSELLQTLGACRDQLNKASMQVRQFGTAYHALHVVMTAIDTLGTYLTGQRNYFALKEHGRPMGDEKYVVLRHKDVEG